MHCMALNMSDWWSIVVCVLPAKHVTAVCLRVGTLSRGRDAASPREHRATQTVKLLLTGTSTCASARFKDPYLYPLHRELRACGFTAAFGCPLRSREGMTVAPLAQRLAESLSALSVGSRRAYSREPRMLLRVAPAPREALRPHPMCRVTVRC